MLTGTIFIEPFNIYNFLATSPITDAPAGAPATSDNSPESSQRCSPRQGPAGLLPARSPGPKSRVPAEAYLQSKRAVRVHYERAQLHMPKIARAAHRKSRKNTRAVSARVARVQACASHSSARTAQLVARSSPRALPNCLAAHKLVSSTQFLAAHGPSSQHSLTVTPASPACSSQPRTPPDRSRWGRQGPNLFSPVQKPWFESKMVPERSEQFDLPTEDCSIVVVPLIISNFTSLPFASISILWILSCSGITIDSIVSIDWASGIVRIHFPLSTGIVLIEEEDSTKCRLRLGSHRGVVDVVPEEVTWGWKQCDDLRNGVSTSSACR
ncbi:SUMO-activating enzyme 2 [Striga asiatica]|uniref:SUMO-activating enzyme 2 n=1 Tax=Striga asiatica TaxID=4170 RepID=A0A5A7P4G2_STRAF|nr:SUMO-activating enzyme 2 [Striga asiatica]